MEVVATRSHQQAAETKYGASAKGVNKSARFFCVIERNQWISRLDVPRFPHHSGEFRQLKTDRAGQGWPTRFERSRFVGALKHLVDRQTERHRPRIGRLRPLLQRME